MAFAQFKAQWLMPIGTLIITVITDVLKIIYFELNDINFIIFFLQKLFKTRLISFAAPIVIVSANTILSKSNDPKHQ